MNYLFRIKYEGSNRMKNKFITFTESKKKKRKKKKKSKDIKRKRYMTPVKTKNMYQNTKTKLNRDSETKIKTNMIPKEIFIHDRMIYSSVIYKYQNQTAKKVGSQMLKVRRDILSDIKQHSCRNQSHIESLSKSVKKYRKKKTNKLGLLNNKYKHNERKKNKTIQNDFETFRILDNKKESQEHKEGTIYDIIQNEQNKPQNIKKSDLRTKLKMKKKNRNYSVLKKKLQIKKKYTPLKSKRINRNKSLYLTNPKISSYKSRTPKIKNNSEYISRNSHFKSDIRKKKRNLINGIGVNREYNLNLIKTRKQFKSINIERQGNACDGKKNMSKRDTSKDTLKINQMTKSMNMNIDSKNDTKRQTCNTEIPIETPSIDTINLLLLKELRESQLQNQQFSEVIKELQKQIEILKNNNQKQSFSFKKLSERKFCSNVSSDQDLFN